jgi:heme-degrading monooxygenase HmoA
MSVLMTLRAAGDPAELERRAAANPEGMAALIESAQSHGLISHRFYGAGEGDIMVLDEWGSAEDFQAFFAANPQIQELMAEVGVSAPPEIKFWRQLDTHDEV